MTQPSVAPRLQVQNLPLQELRLDPRNPRLPEEMQGRPEPVLLRFIADSFNTIEVARSIARYGFFASEPLIAIRELGEFVVVEGNRRLVALKLLADPDMADGLAEVGEWKALAREAAPVTTVPVAIAESREAVAPIVGYRHISGIQPWEPFAKARFIANLVDQGKSFEEVAGIVGDSRTSVASLYRNHQIVKQAREKLAMDTQPVEREFGTFTAAMNQIAVRDYIGVPSPARVKQAMDPIPKNKARNAGELFSWLFGDSETDPVIQDSRQIRQLGEVLKSENGVKVLRTTRSLEEAKLAAGGPRARLLDLLTRASSSLAQALPDIPAHANDPEVLRLLTEIRGHLEALSPPSSDV
jgi:ParB-like chromosome segregation protein Spo0J